MVHRVIVTSDSDRFQDWLRVAFEARQRDAETISMGPFRAVVTRDHDGHAEAWVTLVDRDATEAEAVRSIANLRSAFAKQDIGIEVEYDEVAFPAAGPWLEQTGLARASVNPLMACRPSSFVPVAATEVSLTRLSQHTKTAELEAFQAIRWSDGGDIVRQVPLPPRIELLRVDLKVATSVYLLAWLDWEPVGTGVLHATGNTGEIVGVVTRNDKRRRGVASAVTSELVTRHFHLGGDFVFLDAANEAASRVYQRLGFIRFGTIVIYR